jgi:ABC-type transporter Mla subunit MlaD
MALQDLTPQLRTRLSRLERVVGLFVLLATLLLLTGLGFYIYQRAETKGWFLRKLPYYTFARSAAGLKVGQPIRLMGLEVGEITEIQPQPPYDPYDMFVAFYVKEPYDGYLWDDSRARIGAVDFLGNRSIEVTKGTNGNPTYLLEPFKEVPITEVEAFLGAGPVRIVDEVYDQTTTNVLARPLQRLTAELHQRIVAAGSVATLRIIDTTNQTKMPTAIWNDREGRYQPYIPSGRSRTNHLGYFLPPDESPALTERLETVVNLIQDALPGILQLTNQVRQVLDNASTTTAHADELLVDVRPLLANLTQISSHLTNERGSLGEWLIPTDVAPQLTQTLASANAMLTNSDARLTDLALGLDLTLDNLAQITSNLHAQVRANTNVVSELSRLIVDADDMVQGLKRHWLLRSAFKGTAKTPPKTPAPKSNRVRSPNDPR